MERTRLGSIIPAQASACRACWRRADGGGGGAARSCIDVTSWPVITMTAAGLNTPEQVECRIRQLDELLDLGERFALVIDVRDAKAGGGRDRRLTEWMEARDDVIRRDCACVALVFKSTVVRFMISGVLLVMTRPQPYRVFEAPDEAVRWCRQMLRERASTA